jgi:hypothetical protein
MESRAATQTIRLPKRNYGELRLIVTTIGIVVVILAARWLAYHP